MWRLSGGSWREGATCWGLAVDGAPNHTFESYRIGTDVGLPFLVSPLPSLQAQTRSVLEIPEPVIEGSNFSVTVRARVLESDLCVHVAAEL